MTESNMRIHSYEENEWTLNGKYSTAAEDNNDIFWIKINQDHVLPMWLVGITMIIQQILMCFNRKMMKLETLLLIHH
jgi:hypothetical protein